MKTWKLLSMYGVTALFVGCSASPLSELKDDEASNITVGLVDITRMSQEATISAALPGSKGMARALPNTRSCRRRSVDAAWPACWSTP